MCVRILPGGRDGLSRQGRGGLQRTAGKAEDGAAEDFYLVLFVVQILIAGAVDFQRVGVGGGFCRRLIWTSPPVSIT